jgi:hypothetical protein
MRAALTDPRYFGEALAGDSWANWRVLLIAIAGEALNPDELAVFKALTNRQKAPAEPVAEFWGIIGRRGGKSRAMAVLAAFLAACKDYRHILAPGERGQVQILSATRDQAGNLFNFVCGVFESSKALRGLIDCKTADTLVLKCSIDIVVRPASFRSTRGSTCIAILCDELAYWRSEDSSNPDTEILRALRPSLLTTGGPLVAIGSPYARRGEFWKAYSKHYGKDDSRALVVQAATEVMNPSVDRDYIQAQFDDDAIAAASEYSALFRTDIEAFVSQEAVAAVTVLGRRELPPVAAVPYVAFVDPSGGSSDSMTLAIAHMDRGLAVLDAVRETRPPFSPDNVVEEYADFLRGYGCTRVTGDKYGGEWVREPFRTRGIDYVCSERVKNDIYKNLLPLINSGGVELLDNSRLISQLCSLERRTARGGRDSIDHCPGAHDDVANSAAGALVCLSLDSRQALIRQSDILVNGVALPLPAICKYLLATLVVDKNGMAAVVFGATMWTGPALLIVDYDLQPLSGNLLSAINVKIRELAARCRARGFVCFVPADMARHGVAAGLPAEEIPENMKAEELLLAAANHAAAGSVKICVPAMDKARTTPFRSALDFRASENADDPLRCATLLTIALALDQSA